MVFMRPTYPVSNSVSGKQFNNPFSTCTNFSFPKNDNHDNEVSKFHSDKIPRHTRRHKIDNERNTYEKTREYQHFATSSIESQLHKKPIYSNGTIDAGVKLGTIDEHKSKITHVDETNRRKQLIRIDEISNARKYDDISTDEDITKMIFVSRQETSSPILQDILKKKVIHEKETKDRNELQILNKQTLSNPDQVVQQVLANHALSHSNSDLVTRNFFSETISPVRTTETKVFPSSQEFLTDFVLLVLRGHASQEDLMRHETVNKTQQFDSSKQSAVAELALSDKLTCVTTQSYRSDELQSDNFPRLPSYTEALTYPSLTDYLRDHPMTAEIKHVLNLQTTIDTLPDVNISKRSLQCSFDSPDRNVLKSAVSTSDSLKSTLRTRLGQRTGCVPFNLLETALTDKGNKVPNHSWLSDYGKNDPPPYTFLLPKQRKPPDRLLLS